MLSPHAVRARRWLWGCTWGYLGLLVVVWGLIAVVSERWWLGTVLVYLPRSPWLIPALGLSLASIAISRKAVAVNCLSVLIAAFPIMHWQGWQDLVRSRPDASRPVLRFVSCNVQGFQPNFDLVADEIERISPDVIVFQEVFNDHERLTELLADWQVLREDEYIVASRYPVRLLEQCFVPGFDRITALRCEVTTPDGIVEIVNVHQTSPRRSLSDVRPWSFITGDGLERIERHTVLRDVEAAKTRACVARAKHPVLVAGDFNMPSDSHLFQQHWGDLQDAFAVGGMGYGYTSPCRGNKVWPENHPWAQVDHVLTGPQWQVERCWIGTSAGSDHRLISAVLRFPATRSRGSEESPGESEH